jgi:hypothetical protein
MERTSKRLPSRNSQDEGDDECYEDSKKPAKKSKSRCSVHDCKTNISGCVIDESSTLPLDAFVVVMEFLHPRVRDYFPFLYLYSMENWTTILPILAHIQWKNYYQSVIDSFIRYMLLPS